MCSEPQTLDTFDIHAPGARNGAEGLWEQMRETPGLYHNGRYGGYYVVSRYEDVRTVLMKPAIFASGKGITLPPPDAIRSFHIPAEIDPPAHGEYRALMMKFTTADQARSREPQIREFVVELASRIPVGETFDFVRVFGRPLPILVTLGLLQLPLSDAAELEQLVVDLHAEVASGVSKGAADRLKAYAEGALERRRADAKDADDDLVSSILLGNAFGRALTADEQMSMVRLVLVGGFDTTSAALSSMMLWLANNADQAERLRADPKLIDGASEEIVRRSSPSTYLRRELTEDFELSGVKLRKGESVLVSFGAANLDPARFECPMQVRPDRKPNLHVGFGMGNHRCIGSFIAKTQIRVAFEELLARFDRFEVPDEGAIAYSTGLGQGIISLPMILSRA